jgi:hypothetical protein
MWPERNFGVVLEFGFHFLSLFPANMQRMLAKDELVSNDSSGPHICFLKLEGVDKNMLGLTFAYAKLLRTYSGGV